MNTRRDAQLAVLLRRAQWLLDDAAHTLPEGACSLADREALAIVCDELAAALRDQHPAQVVEGELIQQ